MIRSMEQKDKNVVIDMMKEFYASEAVLTNGSMEIFLSDVENCISDSPYLEGFVFEEEERIAGYAMLAKSFSTEFGKPCIWIEDLYLIKEFRGKGIGSSFFQYLESRFPDAIFRLEVEKENISAIHTYKANAFQFIPYEEMIKK